MTRLLSAFACLLIAACGAGEREAARNSPNVAGALIISYSADSADTFVANRLDSVLALDWLREVARLHDIRLEATTYPYGTLVKSIGHRANGEGGYWLYKVNGQMVPKSADAHSVAWSDTLMFFFDER